MKFYNNDTIQIQDYYRDTTYHISIVKNIDKSFIKDKKLNPIRPKEHLLRHKKNNHFFLKVRDDYYIEYENFDKIVRFFKILDIERSSENIVLRPKLNVNEEIQQFILQNKLLIKKSLSNSVFITTYCASRNLYFGFSTVIEPSKLIENQDLKDVKIEDFAYSIQFDSYEEIKQELDLYHSYKNEEFDLY